MKKAMKKTMACMLACLQLSIGTMLSVSAAPTVSEADFDGTAITNPASAAATQVSSGFYVKGLSNTAVSDEDTTKWAAKTVTQVDDPISGDRNDRAVRFLMNSDTQSNNWEIYRGNPTKAENTVYVWEFSIMLTGKFNNKVVGLNTKNKDGKYVTKKLLQFVDGSGTAYGKVQIKDYVDTTNLKTVEYNQWYNIKTVLDYKTNAESAKIYINGELFTEVSLADHLNSYPTVVQAGLFVYNSDKAEPDRYMYIDDWKYYQTEDASTFEMTDYSGAVFMAGSQVDFKSRYYLGADMDYLDLEKVEYYDNDVKVGESTAAPYDFSYVPQGAGAHTVTAKGYISEVGGDDPVVTESTTFVVEQSFTENVIMSEDFEEYTDGTTAWDSNDTVAGSWVVTANATGEEVDAEHGRSLRMPGTSGQILRARNMNITSGTVKVSGEFKGFAGNSNVLYILCDSAKSNKRHFNLHAAMNLLDSQNSNTAIAAVKGYRWHKIDVITTLKDSKGYYSVYLDGKRVVQRAYNDDAALKDIVGVDYFSAYNTGKTYIDNLSVSVIKYNDETTFSSNGVKAEQVSEITGTTLKAETPCANALENKQYFAIYNSSDNELIDVKPGTYNAGTGKYEAECDLTNKNIYAKVFLWDNMKPAADFGELR